MSDFYDWSQIWVALAVSVDGGWVKAIVDERGNVSAWPSEDEAREALDGHMLGPLIEYVRVL